MTHNTQPKRSTSQIVFDAVVDLHAAEQVVTREALVQVTGLKMTIVDDRIAALVDDERVRRVMAGVFMPNDIPPPARAITTTMLPWGWVKLEIGDECMDLTPREARMLGRALAGHAMEFASIQAGREAVAIGAEVARAIKEALLTDKTMTG
ncbi:hypothetical protein [Aquabacterium sp.]|uniref:hypothetical protein n=1 Tax=Aquabacterium sp. TaxID=1872578 RepID=UPI0024892D5B|nr:hypothetical protein [Aquabacterium sp.]MDI1260242.1 hypothetical protein [Aquabacterium sp.]